MRRAAASALRICAQKSFMLRSFPEAVLLPEKFPAGCNPRPILSYCTVLLMQIFFLCSKSSPDVPFGFVYIQHLPGFRRQSGVDLSQAFGYVLMYRTFTHPVRFRRLPHRGIVVDDIIGDTDGTFFDIILQRNTPQEYFLPLYEGLGEGMTGLGGWFGLFYNYNKPFRDIHLKKALRPKYRSDTNLFPLRLSRLPHCGIVADDR